jgi:nickel transport protein
LYRLLEHATNYPRILCGLYALWALSALPDAACAHRVHLFAWDEDGRVCSRSYYGKAANIADAELTVRDADGKELLRGRSDREGLFCFARPGAAELLLSVDAGQGHRGEFRLSAKTTAATARPENGTRPDPSRPAAGPADHEELRRIMREELERVLPPLLERNRKTAQASAQEEEPGLREILGGLGWIAGLAALLAWHRRRRAS